MAAKPRATMQSPKYSLVTNPRGYFNKREITNLDERSLVKGTKNMIINDGDKVATRAGFTRDGQASTVNNGIDNNYDFVSKNGKKILRVFEGDVADEAILQVRVVNEDDTIEWYDLKDDLVAGSCNFTSWWDEAEVTRVAIFVDNSDSLHVWGGGVGFIASNTATTITLSGTETWAELGFYINKASRAVTIPGYGTYTYTGGETTQTLTGLTAVPAITAGTPVFQSVMSTNTLTGIPANSFENIDLITTKDNHVIIGSTISSVVWGSNTDDYADFTFGTPLRAANEGFKITLDNFAVGFIQDDEYFGIFAGFDEFYKIKFVFNADQSGESLLVTKLRAGNGQAAISQKSIIPVKNGFMYITQDKTLSWLTSIQNVFTPQSLPISDPIKNDFDSFDMTGATGVFFENEAWIAIPRENLVYRYDFDKALWQSPQTIPVSCFSIIDNELYGHSNSQNVSYKLNEGTDDDGVTIDFVAAFAYRSFGERAIYKKFNRYYNELYMPSETTVTVTHRYDYLGSRGVVEKTILGTDEDIIYTPNIDGNLGKENLGKNPLGGLTDDVPVLNKVRVIHQMKAVDFFEHQVIYSSSSHFEILSHGPNVENSTNLPIKITK